MLVHVIPIALKTQHDPAHDHTLRAVRCHRRLIPEFAIAVVLILEVFVKHIVHREADDTLAPRQAIPQREIDQRKAAVPLRQDGGCCTFDFLVDITCVDYLYYRDAKDRFGLVYLLANAETAERITVRTSVNDPDPTVLSAVSLWEGANWLEREVWDLFGIRFEGHPDLRRIVLPEEFTAHPLRKDYPLQGRGERHNFPVIGRAEG